MKTLLLAAGCLLLFASPAKAWNCSNPLDARVPVPAGTKGTFGDGDGQLFLGTGSEGVKGQLYACQPPTTDSKSGMKQKQQQTQSQNQSAKSASTSNSDSSSKSKSDSTSTVKNSGNSSNANTNNTSATGGNQSQTASSANNSNGNISTYDSTSTFNQVRQTPPAYAPDILSNNICMGGISGGASTPVFGATFGASKLDKGCDSRQTAIIFHGLGNDSAAAKILCSTEASKRAHLTIEDCALIVRQPQPQVVIRESAPVQPPTVIIVPQPQPEPAPSTAVKVEEQSVLIDTFKLVNGRLTNVGKRHLDDDVRRLNNTPNSKLRIRGPWEAASVVAYLREKGISETRIGVTSFTDEQNSTVSLEMVF